MASSTEELKLAFDTNGTASKDVPIKEAFFTNSLRVWVESVFIVGEIRIFVMIAELLF
jgi:hypothetical protein